MYNIKENNLQRLDLILNRLEPFFRSIYSDAGKADATIDRDAHIVALIKQIESPSGEEVIKTRTARVSTSTSRELCDRDDLFIKVPLASNQIKKLYGHTHIFFISERDYRYDGKIEIIQLECHILFQLMKISIERINELFKAHNIFEKNGYRLFPLKSILKSTMIVGHYSVDYKNYTYIDLIATKTLPLLDKSIPLFWYKFKLIMVPPYKGIKIRDKLADNVYRFDSISKASEILNVPIESISKVLRGINRTFGNKRYTAEYQDVG
jgi:hypothetical protein